MKNTILGPIVAFLLVGCDVPEYKPSVDTFFPTNHWRVTSVIDEEVVVETLETNLLERFRVVKAKPMSPLTNGQPVRVEMTLGRKPGIFGPNGVLLLSAKAYPALD